jgi:hypothetical protein
MKYACSFPSAVNRERLIMSSNRLAGVWSSTDSAVALGTANGGAGFLLCPLAWQVTPEQASLWQQVYQLAWARTLAVMQPSRVELLQRVSVN